MPVTFIRYMKPKGEEPPVESRQFEIGEFSGGADDNNLKRAPFYGLYDYSQGGFIYTIDELVKAGITMDSLITGLEFQFKGWSTGYTVNNQSIKMGHTDATVFPPRVAPNYEDNPEISITDLTEVKSNFTFVIPRKENFEKLEFNKEFRWDGRSNIIISWENRDGSWASGYGHLRGVNTRELGHRSHFWFADRLYPTADSSWSGFRANLKLWVKVK
jgi:hypothetical protein